MNWLGMAKPCVFLIPFRQFIASSNSNNHQKPFAPRSRPHPARQLQNATRPHLSIDY
jgi:hypothetical protein